MPEKFAAADVVGLRASGMALHGILIIEALARNHAF